MFADTMQAYLGPWGLGLVAVQLTVPGLLGWVLALLTRRRTSVVQGAQA
jgi:hypothetical protein